MGSGAFCHCFPFFVYDLRLKHHCFLLRRPVAPGIARARQSRLSADVIPVVYLVAYLYPVRLDYEVLSELIPFYHIIAAVIIPD